MPTGRQDTSAYLNAPLDQPRLAGSREPGLSSRAGRAPEDTPEGGWSPAPPRGRRHRAGPEPEAAPEPAFRDHPAERTGPRRHGRRADDSGGWDSPQLVGGHLAPGEAPVPGPAAGARARSGQTARGRIDSGPIPAGRAASESLGARAGLEAGFVADRGFDLDDRGAAVREPAGRSTGRPGSGPAAVQAPADRRGADEDSGGRRPRGRAALREAPPEPDAEQEKAGPGAGRSRRSSRAEQPERAERPERRTGRRRSRGKLMIGAGLAVVLAGAAVVVGSGALVGNGPKHVLVTPDKLGAYVRRPQLEKQMNAGQLQKEVITKSAGQASHVVSAVYEDGTSATSSKTPQMILFIGGNLSGVSASGFIASFTQQSKGAFVASAGSLGGSAACVNAQASVPGSVALCTWADNDTFGVVASPTMTATRLATQLRVIRPMVEHVAR